jgi:serine/threonine protein kinase
LKGNLSSFNHLSGTDTVSITILHVVTSYSDDQKLRSQVAVVPCSFIAFVSSGARHSSTFCLHKAANGRSRLQPGRFCPSLDSLPEDFRAAHCSLTAENAIHNLGLNIRLIDFGLSKAFTGKDPTFWIKCGSPAHTEPKVPTSSLYTKTADIWSAGLLLYAMVLGHLPFVTDTAEETPDQTAYAEPFFPGYLPSRSPTSRAGAS